jgi:hypothetical protein
VEVVAASTEGTVEAPASTDATPSQAGMEQMSESMGEDEVRKRDVSLSIAKRMILKSLSLAITNY